MTAPRPISTVGATEERDNQSQSRAPERRSTETATQSAPKTANGGFRRRGAVDRLVAGGGFV
jgi:hypothetical protein